MARLIAIAALVALVAALAQTARLHSARTALVTLQRDAAQSDAARAEARAAAERSARELEHVRAQAVAAVDAAWREGHEDATRKGNAVAADLRSDNLRLRREWQGCEERAGDLPAPAAATGEPDDAADLRAAGAGALVRIGAECDAKLRGWQQYAEAVTGAR